MSRFSSDDPRLTAYALGELRGDDVDAIESDLKSDAELRRAVADVRTTADLLTKAFASEPSPGLTDIQRERVRNAEFEPLNHPLIFRSRALWVAVTAAVAACLAIAVIWTFSYSPRHSQPFARGSATELVSPADSDELGESARELTRGERKIEDGERTTLNRRDQFAGKESALAVSSEDQSFTDAGNEASSHGRTMTQPVTPAAPPSATTTRTAVEESLGADRQGSSVARLRSAAGAGINTNSLGAEPDNALNRDDRTVTLGLHSSGIPGGNVFVKAADAKISSFGLKPNLQSFSYLRHLLNSGRMPDPKMVRIEDMLNSFRLNYSPPTDEEAFAARVEVNDAPWQKANRLVRIGLQARQVTTTNRPSSNLVFLVDVSGSMNEPSKLPIVKRSLANVVNELAPDDRVAVLTNDAQGGITVAPTSCTPEKKPEILKSIDQLSITADSGDESGGDLHMAYELATTNYIRGGLNQVIVCTDDDSPVSEPSDGSVAEMISKNRETGVYLSVLRFGESTKNDTPLLMKGNGTYACIDSPGTGKDVLHLAGTLVPIARDVQVHVEFNPELVSEYRLLGYETGPADGAENGGSKREQTAREIWPGHSVTALYEVVMNTQASEPVPAGDGAKAEGAAIASIRLSYLQADAQTPGSAEFEVRDTARSWNDATADFKFLSAVAWMGMLLRNTPDRGDATISDAVQWATEGLNGDHAGERLEFIGLLEQVRALMHTPKPHP